MRDQSDGLSEHDLKIRKTKKAMRIAVLSTIPVALAWLIAIVPGCNVDSTCKMAAIDISQLENTRQLIFLENRFRSGEEIFQ